jgi:hypothetical protein
LRSLNACIYRTDPATDAQQAVPADAAAVLNCGVKPHTGNTHKTCLETNMQIEHRTKVAAAPETIFRIYEDVANWHTWDPDTKRAFLNGPLQPGSRGKLTPTKGNTVPMLVTEVDANRLFTVESKIPLFRMRFEHELKPNADGTEVIHRVELSGPLTLFLGPMLARQLNAGLPVTLRNLKHLAESQSTT